jgi:hypothetical protein
MSRTLNMADFVTIKYAYEASACIYHNTDTDSTSLSTQPFFIIKNAAEGNNPYLF